MIQLEYIIFIGILIEGHVNVMTYLSIYNIIGNVEQISSH